MVYVGEKPGTIEGIEIYGILSTSKKCEIRHRREERNSDPLKILGTLLDNELVNNHMESGLPSQFSEKQVNPVKAKGKFIPQEIQIRVLQARAISNYHAPLPCVSVSKSAYPAGVQSAGSRDVALPPQT
jgi:hypothetical protein